MKILVTGGAGFIGSNFLNLLVPRHPEHQFLNIDKLGYASNLHNLSAIEGCSNYHFARLDLTDVDGVNDCFEREAPDVVVHFAAESHVDRSIKSPTGFIQSNIVGTFNLLEAFRNASHTPSRFHHVSTDEVYGSLGPEGRFVEDSPYDPSSPYSASKAASDHLVRAWGRTYGLPFTITNCSNNYGPFQFPEKLIPLMILNATEHVALPVYGQGLNVRDWLYVDDHCEAIWTVLEKGQLGETYNVGGDSEKKNLEVIHEICDIVADLRGEDPESLRQLITSVTDRPGHDLRYAIDATKLERDCAWRPRESFHSGLEKTVRWYLDNPAWVESVRTGAYRDWLATQYATDRSTHD
ncbi:MAG: dTDP-glucose 4,6-dehydratase [Deltaproteobacteria bacterium CG_4_9_14_3_um_filter_63_12]|nr:MAG: dTDP-glucose 4,6-dehydratase [Deltaproteobacteria bacterium CG_4_9_14_3_um_filter_63_12]